MLRPFLLAGLLLPLSLPGQADVLGGTVGVNLWAQHYDARARDGGDFVDFGSEVDVDDEADYQIYFSLEHPIPVLPNVLIQHTESSTQGNGVIGLTIFDGVLFEGAVSGELELTHTDFTAYYEVLDNWVQLDIGLTARKFDASVTLLAADGSSASARTDDVLPLAYAAAQFDLPFTGWKIKTSGNYVQYDGDSLYDVSAAVGWEAIAGLGLELGYRYMDIDYSDGQELVEAQVEGIYAGVLWDF